MNTVHPKQQRKQCHGEHASGTFDREHGLVKDQCTIVLYGTNILYEALRVSRMTRIEVVGNHVVD
jgi:hypothetical protein